MATDPMTDERFEDVLIFALGTLDELVRKGMVYRDSGAAELAPAGMKRFYELKLAGFTATETELHAATTLFVSFRNDDEVVAAGEPE